MAYPTNRSRLYLAEDDHTSEPSLDGPIMPLHLLGKKSWNVYNPENVDRVRRDEAAARSAQQEAEKTQSFQDAQHRLSILRGEQENTTAVEQDPVESVYRHGQKRKRSPEHSTERVKSGESTGIKSSIREPHEGSSLLRASAEHNPSSSQGSRRATSREDTSSVNDLDNISNMKFRDAEGKSRDSRGPWYAQSSSKESAEPGKDVWGNEDPGRKARNEHRMKADDPLLAMKKGVQRLRQAEQHRKDWMAQRERDLDEVEELARRHRKHKRPRRDDDKHRRKDHDRRKHRSRSHRERQHS